MNPDPASNPTTDAAVSERQSSGWDIRNAPRNYFWLIIYQFGSAAFAFAAVWLITRRLGSEGYGGIVAVIAASQVAQVFTNWTGISVVRFGVDEFVETAAVARTFWTRFCILAVNLALVLLLASFWYPPLADWLRLSPEAYWLVVAHFAVTAVWAHIQVGMQAAKMLRSQGFLLMLERLLIFAGLAVLIAIQKFEFYSVVVFYIAAPAAMTLAGLFRLRSVIFSRFSFDAGSFRTILVYSLPLLPFTLVGFFSGSYVDAAFISKFLSTRDLGIYSIATQVNGIAMQVPTLANTLLLPLLVTLQAESGKERSFHYFRNVLPGLVLLWGVACAALAFAGYLLIPIVFSPEFSGAVTPMWILLSASVVWIPIAIGYSALANSISSTYIPMVAGFFSAAVNIGANFALIPRYGMIGCAAATLLAYSAAVLVFAILLKQKAKMPISWTFLAFVPSVAGAAVLLAYQSPLLALGTCLAISCLLAIMKKGSIRELYGFISNFRGATR